VPGADEAMATWLTGEMTRLDAEYRARLVDSGRTSNIMLVARRAA